MLHRWLRTKDQNGSIGHIRYIKYSNKAPRLSDQTSIFGVVFFVSKSLLGIEGQEKLEKFAILTRKARSHVRILIYRTWPIARTALLDYRKAFDMVDHHLLRAKLFSLGVKPTTINRITDFLRGRKQRVKLNNNYCY